MRKLLLLFLFPMSLLGITVSVDYPLHNIKIDGSNAGGAPEVKANWPQHWSSVSSHIQGRISSDFANPNVSRADIRKMINAAKAVGISVDQNIDNQVPQ